MTEAYCLEQITEEKLSLLGCKDIEDLLNIEVLKKLGFEYGIVYNYDSVVSSRIENIRIDKENIIEGRFFNEKHEIRIFCDEGIYSGNIFDEKDDCDSIVQEFFLYPRYGESIGYAEKLKIKKYIDYDKDDGQAFISYVKPSELIIKE